MSIREKPRIKIEGKDYYWHDWYKGDYTKTFNTINYSTLDLSNIPKKPGIYFFYADDVLLYVGMSVNIRTRIGAHISCNKHITRTNDPPAISKYMHNVNRVEFELYNEEDLPWIEMFYICKLKPKLNGRSF